LQRSVLATSLWSEISNADFASRSLYDVLGEQCGIALDRASETIRAVSLDDDEAALLGVMPGSAALESIRVSRTVDGAAFLYDRALLRGEATEIRTERSAVGMRVAFQTL
jgi:GntR family transcriptional regulator